MCSKADCCQLNLYLLKLKELSVKNSRKEKQTRMWANAQPDGRPAEHNWRRLFNTAKFG